MGERSFFFRYKIHHWLGWLLLLGGWYYFRYLDYPSETIAFRVTLLKVVDLALMIYVANYVLVPRLLYRKKYGWFALAFFAMVLGSSIGKMILIGKITGRPDLFDLSISLKDRIYDNVIPHFFLVIAGVAVKLIYDFFVLQRKLAEMAKEKAEAELSFLKSQINPHFIFNSLNAIYFLIDRENTAARNTLHKFSEMLRYQLYEVKGDKIPIEKEVAYLKDYVDLQKLRRDDRYKVEFNCQPGVSEFYIEPLLLVPFVENAFKHISHKAGEINYIHVGISKEDGQFIFSVVNSCEAEKSTESTGGIGLNNVRRRLELLYPEKHELTIRKDEQRFEVSLTLKIEG